MNSQEAFIDLIPTTLRDQAQRLLVTLRATGGVVVAMSAGVDSSFLAAAACAALGDRALAVTGISPSIPQREVKAAREIAALIDIRHLEIPVHELESEAYRANEPDRCFHCKSTLFEQLRKIADEYELPVIADGNNLDDVADYRPGRRAAAVHGVISPLADAGFTKIAIRTAAQAIGLPNYAKPASPCLSSRFPYGTPINREALAMVEQAEDALLELGFSDCRVRKYGELAKLELPLTEMVTAMVPSIREKIVARIRATGFQQVVLDLQGIRSGNLNAALKKL